MRKSKRIFVVALLLTGLSSSAPMYAEEVKVKLNVPTVF